MSRQRMRIVNIRLTKIRKVIDKRKNLYYNSFTS